VDVSAPAGLAAALLLAADARVDADTGRVGPVGLAASLVLVAVVVAVSRWRRLGLGRDVVTACALALVQLLLVGAGLGLVVGDDRPLWPSWIWVGVMLVYAAWITRRRAPEVPRLFSLALIALTAALAVSLGVVFGLGVFHLTTRTLVPTAGLIVGNALTSTVVVARRTVEDLRDKRQEVEARLALGLPAEQAARPHVRAALRTALSPQIERTRGVGLVALPGAMTGLLLAGVDPLVAVAVQAVIMYLVLGSAAVVGAVLALGLLPRLFTSDHRLRPLPRPADAS
jgi:putative ABC transport system permease protein